MDELLIVQSDLERQVFHAVADLLNLEVDLIYFDTTSSYFEVDPFETPEGESLRKQGFSKDKRPDLVQIRTHESWPNVRDECERLMLGHFSSKNGDLYQRTELTTKQAQFFAALGLEPPPKILGIHPRA